MSNAFPGYLLELEESGKVHFANGQLCRLLGEDPGSIKGLHWLETFVVAEDRTVFAAGLRACSQEPEDTPTSVECRLIAKGRTPRLIWHVVRLANNHPTVMWRCYGIRTSDQPRASNAPRENEQRLQAILRTAVDGIITINEHGLIESFNPACEKMFGYASREVLGHNVKMLMPEQFSKHHDEYLSNYRTTRRRRVIGTGREVLGMRRDGSTFPLLITISETKLPNGNCFFTGILKDVSAPRQAELELRRANESLMVQTMFNQRLSALAAMAGGVAHELNQPLSSIRVYAQTLMGPFDTATLANDEIGQTLRKIVAQVDRAAHVIEHMRTFASESSETSSQTVSIRDSIESVLGLIGQQLANHDVQLVNEVDPSARVSMDPHRLEQVIINLLVNAKDSIQEKGDDGPRLICVSSLAAPPGRVRISIADTGKGVPEEMRGRLFEPFVTSKGPDRGTGLGLSICHGILNDYGARIRLAATGADGTDFHLDFRSEGVK